MNEQNNQTPATVEVVDIQFRPGQKVYYFDPGKITCKAGDAVIIDTARGPEYGICSVGNHVENLKGLILNMEKTRNNEEC